MAVGPVTPSAPRDTYDVNGFLVIICASLGGYNALELLLLIFTTFSAYHGLYFWALLVATTAILPYAIGLCIFYFEWTEKLVGYIINNIGWWFMITGQSVVLYSRLGIVLGRGYENLLKFVKWMIIIDALVFCSMSTIVVFGRYYAPNPVPFGRAYKYVEKIQMTAFCLQEFIISGLYVWKTLDILKTGKRKNAHRVMWQLFVINVLIIIIDIALLTLEYRNLFIPEVAFKTLAYSIKLKLEFAILSKLVDLSSKDGRRMSTIFADATDFRSDATQSDVGPSSVIPSPTLESSHKPCWTIDLERMKSIQSKSEGATNTKQAEISNAEGDHNFESKQAGHLEEATPVSVDLLYAEAMRTVSK